jgi:hypothetical protein
MLPLSSVQAATPIAVELTAEYFSGHGDVTFSSQEGFPQGLITVKGGGAVLKDRTFASGTIEYDIREEPNGKGIAGLWFHQRDDDSAEQVYLRTSPNCPQSNDCVQYAPVTHGLLLWDIYPEYQAHAPVKENGWNHVKLVVSGRRMNVFVNGQLAPALAVGRLEGDALTGSLQLRGDATFANLTITPDAVEGLPSSAAKDLTDSDHRYLRSWLASAPAALPRDKEASLAELPADPKGWQPLAAERKGLVNLSRRYGSPLGADPAVVWLKTTITSTRSQAKRVAIGWTRKVWVFVNGKPLFADKNLYYPAAARRHPDGRLALENGSFELPLDRGRNELIVAVSNDFPQSSHHWGWGLELRLADLDGIQLGR